MKQTYSASGITPQMPGPEGIHQRAANAAPSMVAQGPPPPNSPPPGYSPGPFSHHASSTPPRSGHPPMTQPGPSPMTQAGPPPVSGFIRSPPK